jgi:hypothetical protein
MTGWWFQPSSKMMEFVNGKDDIPYMKWKITNVWNHQPDWVPPKYVWLMGKKNVEIDLKLRSPKVLNFDPYLK